MKQAFGTIHSAGAYLKSALGVILSVTAGGSGDNTWTYSPVIDRLPQGEQEHLHLAAFAEVNAAIGAGETGALDLKIQHGDEDDGDDMADYVDNYGQGSVAGVAVAEGATSTKLAKVYASLVGAKRYVRVGVRLNLSRANTDTAAVSVVPVLVSSAEQPIEA